jgi:hypothetical protein
MYTIIDNTLFYKLDIPITYEFINICKENKIIKIDFCSSFNHSIDMLEKLDELQILSLKSSKWFSKFNQPINKLSKNIHTLILGFNSRSKTVYFFIIYIQNIDILYINKTIIL